MSVMIDLSGGQELLLPEDSNNIFAKLFASNLDNKRGPGFGLEPFPEQFYQELFNIFKDVEKNSFDDDGEYWGVVSSGDDVPYVPSSSLAIVLGFVSDSGLTGNLRLVSNGSACSTAACGIYQNIDSHNFIDTNLRKAVNENLDVFMVIENLLDSADVVARAPKDGARAQKPRTMKVGFSYKF